MYAELDGVTHRAEGSDALPVNLVAPAGQEPPDGFAEDRRGLWIKRVEDPSEIDRLYRVRTTARWSRWTVDVDRVEGDMAWWSYDGDGLPLDDRRIHRSGWSEWQGHVPVAELEDPVEVVHELLV
ncbi:hypothetical protein [Cellulomonas fimi]|uniref:hypothetical protein n=1 Tax=Cellulomonas fimi TaxID=1708 RepID=UPI00235984A7|nr:hypothetical protein [Cellulomonas fimi]